MSTPPGDLIETVTLEVRAAGDGARSVAVTSPPAEIHDVWAYRVAVVSIGTALSVFLIGAAVIFAVTKTVPEQYWTAGSAISGALIGLLVPSKAEPKESPREVPGQQPSAQGAGRAEEPWWMKAQTMQLLAENLRLVVLLAIFIASVVLTAAVEPTQELRSLAAASGAALIGLLVPAPHSASARTGASRKIAG